MPQTTSITAFSSCLPYFEMWRDPQRQAILVNLIQHQELTVTEIVKLSNLSTPAISHHLKLLSHAGLVSSRKVGTTKFYKAELHQAVLYLKELISSLEADLGAVG